MMLVVVAGGSWRFVAFGGEWLGGGGWWWWWVVFGGDWWCLVVFGGAWWWLVAVCGGGWWWLAGVRGQHVTGTMDEYPESFRFFGQHALHGPLRFGFLANKVAGCSGFCPNPSSDCPFRSDLPDDPRAGLRAANVRSRSATKRGRDFVFGRRLWARARRRLGRPWRRWEDPIRLSGNRWWEVARVLDGTERPPPEARRLALARATSPFRFAGALHPQGGCSVDMGAVGTCVFCCRDRRCPATGWSSNASGAAPALPLTGTAGAPALRAQARKSRKPPVLLP